MCFSYNVLGFLEFDIFYKCGILIEIVWKWLKCKWLEDNLCIYVICIILKCEVWFRLLLLIEIVIEII